MTLNNICPLTLADIFLEVLEQKYNDESQKSYIRKVKTLMDVPECAEYLSFGLMNAMGNPTPIATSTVDKAVDCLTHFYEDNIKSNQEMTKKQKEVQKGLMKGFMSEYKVAVKNLIASKNLLLE
jgi:predicted adenine nucleotide alpha hydrolase (AANH) superfamily ATPase